MRWVLGLLSLTHLNGLMSKVPPPIYSRMYQEVSSGMLGYLQAERVISVPLPIVIVQISNAGVFILLCILPFVMENTVQSKILTPLLTFIISYSFLLIHVITNLLENPFGDDFVDLPLLEVHMLFNEKLLAGEPIEYGLTDPPEPPSAGRGRGLWEALQKTPKICTERLGELGTFSYAPRTFFRIMYK